MIARRRDVADPEAALAGGDPETDGRYVLPVPLSPSRTTGSPALIQSPVAGEASVPGATEGVARGRTRRGSWSAGIEPRRAAAPDVGPPGRRPRS